MDERRSRSREPLVHGVAALLGPTAGGLLLGTFALHLVVRTAALAVGLSLVGAGLARAVSLGRDEWRRRRPGVAAYAGVVMRFAVAFVLVVVATA